MSGIWTYHLWPSGEPYEWMGNRHDHPDDQLDFHVDLGCGRIKKARIGVDRYPAPGVNVVADLNTLERYAEAPEPGRDAVEPQGGNGAMRWHFGAGKKFYDAGAGVTPGNVLGKGLPFMDGSIRSMISHHALEHIGPGFIALMDECWRVLTHGGIFRIVVPLFPSTTAVEDPDHVRWFMDGTFDAFCGDLVNPLWCDSFSVPYTKARFEMVAKDMSPLTPPEQRWTQDDRREMRVTLRAVKQ